jgi:hypothetical protein
MGDLSDEDDEEFWNYSVRKTNNIFSEEKVTKS